VFAWFQKKTSGSNRWRVSGASQHSKNLRQCLFSHSFRKNPARRHMLCLLRTQKALSPSFHECVLPALKISVLRKTLKSLFCRSGKENAVRDKTVGLPRSPKHQDMRYYMFLSLLLKRPARRHMLCSLRNSKN
jgi:hypothetical protein